MRKTYLVVILAALFLPAQAWIINTTLEAPTNATWTNANNDTIQFVFTQYSNFTALCKLWLSNETGTWYLAGENASVFANTTTTLYANFSLAENTTYGWHWYVNCSNTTYGEYNSSEIWILFIDRTEPLVSYVQPTIAEGNYSQNYIEVNVSAEDANVSTIAIRLYDGSFNLIQTQSQYFGSKNAYYFYNFTSLADGIYYFNATANDTAGNANSTPTRKIILDITPPYIAFVNPTPPNNTYTTKNYIEANVTTSDNLAGIDTVTIYLYNSTHVFTSSGTFANFTNLISGTYYLNATVNDTAGNLNKTETRVIHIDLDPPKVSFVAPTPANDTYTNKGYIEINVSATDNFNVNAIIIRIYNSTGLVNETIATVNSQQGYLFMNFTGVVNSTYYINATANDTVGNTNKTETRQTTIDQIPPYNVDISAEYPGKHWYAFSLRNNNPPYDFDTLEVYVNGTLYNTYPGTSNIFVNITGLDSYTFYNFTFKVLDKAGNTNQTSLVKRTQPDCGDVIGAGLGGETLQVDITGCKGNGLIINVTTQNYILYCGGHVIEFGTAGNYAGIVINPDKTGPYGTVTLEGCVIRPNSTLPGYAGVIANNVTKIVIRDDSSSGDRMKIYNVTRGIVLYGVSNLTVENTDITLVNPSGGWGFGVQKNSLLDLTVQSSYFKGSGINTTAFSVQSIQTLSVQDSNFTDLCFAFDLSNVASGTIYRNNFININRSCGLPVRAINSNIALNTSTEGNYWGHNICPAFRVGEDAYPSALIDYHAYLQPNGWLYGSSAECAPKFLAMRFYTPAGPLTQGNVSSEMNNGTLVFYYYIYTNQQLKIRLYMNSENLQVYLNTSEIDGNSTNRPFTEIGSGVYEINATLNWTEASKHSCDGKAAYITAVDQFQKTNTSVLALAINIDPYACHLASITANSTNFTQINDFTHVVNLYFEGLYNGEAIGSVNFTDPIDLTDPATIDALDQLGQNMQFAYETVDINAAANALREFNKSAIVKLYGLSNYNADPGIFMNGIPVVLTGQTNSSDNYTVTYKNWDPINHVLTFHVAHWTNYSSDGTTPVVSVLGLDQDWTVNNGTANVSYTDTNYRIYVNISDDHLEQCWYSINGGTNTTWDCSNPLSLSNLPNGWVTIDIWANDSVGHLGHDSTMIYEMCKTTLDNEVFTVDHDMRCYDAFYIAVPGGNVTLDCQNYKITGTHYAVWDQFSSGIVENVTLKNCKFYGAVRFSGAFPRDVKIINNEFHNTLRVDNVTHYLVQGNTFTDGGYIETTTGFEDVNITSNVFENLTSSYAIYMKAHDTNGTGLRISSNRINNFSSKGIYLMVDNSMVLQATVTNNNITNGPTAFYLNSVSSLTLNATSNYYCGISNKVLDKGAGDYYTINFHNNTFCINLWSPSDNAWIDSGNTTFKFELGALYNATQCYLYYGGISVKNITATEKANNTIYYTVSSAGDWHIYCIDSQDNSGTSETRHVNLKYADGHSCSASYQCAGGYCVHGYCSSSETYCGDGYCEGIEDYATCPSDCEAPSTGLTLWGETEAERQVTLYPDMKKEVKIAVKDLPLEKLELTPAISGRAKVVVRKITKVSKPLKKAYKYFEIKVEAKVKEAWIYFNVEKSWLNENNVDARDIVLMKLIDGRWNALETEMLSEGSTRIYYRARTPGFSIFAIGTKEKVEEKPVISPNKTEEKPVIQQPEEEEKPVIPQGESKMEKKFSAKYVAFVLTLLAIAIFAYFKISR